jgi:hypothetical protein
MPQTVIVIHNLRDHSINSKQLTNNFTGNKVYFLYTNVLSTEGDYRNGYRAYPKRVLGISETGTGHILNIAT